MKSRSRKRTPTIVNLTVKRRYLTEREVDRLVDRARKHGRYGHRDATMILVAYRHGLRASEVCDLQWQQIELSEGHLHVHRVKNGIPSVHPIRGDEMRALRKLRRDYPRDAHVFVSERGGPINAQELRCSCRPAWPVDRPCAWPKAAAWHRARHGFEREPDPWRAGEERLERPLRLHLLSPAVRVQPVWRPRTLRSASRQRSQRRWMGRCAQAGRGALPPGQGLTHLVSSGRGLCNARGLPVSGGGADQIRDPVTGQPGSAEQDRLSAHAPSRTTSAPCAPVPCQFQLSGWNLDQAAEGYRQGRVASRRTLSPRRFHRDQHEPPGRARRCFLQQARDVRAMDQGGQRRDQVDATVVPNVRRQRGAAPASCARLQPRQFPAHAGDAGADQGLVADESEGQADQDRREGSEPRPLCYLPDGRGRHRTANVPRDIAADRGATAAATTSASVRRSMSCIQEQPTEGARPNARENAQIRPSTKRSGYPRCW